MSDGYLQAMGIGLHAGRDLTDHDNTTGKPVILVNETLARTLWPGRDPIGQFMSADIDRQVVGVVRDVHHLALEQGAGNEMYIPMRQISDYPSVDLGVRGSLPPAARWHPRCGQPSGKSIRALPRTSSAPCSRLWTKQFRRAAS